MATLLADSPPAPSDAQPQPDGPTAAPAGPAAAPPPALSARGCARCGAEMAAGQDWCLQCGAGAPGSLGAPRWRSAATVFALVAALLLGAAAAAVAALSNGSAKAPVVTTTVAAAPTASTPTTSIPTTPGATSTTPEVKSPLGAVKPPKIPLAASTPKASEKTATTTPSPETTTSTPSTGTTPTSGSGAAGEKTNDESQQSAILLDTNAASTYDPYEYPASEFSGPSLAIDDDPTTAWTAAVNPATAPKMAEGLLIDLKDKQKVAVLELITSTPGMTVQVYGAKGRPAPASITDPAWKPLSAPKVIKKKRTRLALRDSKKEFTYITLWISQAPTSAAGTATVVAVNELELFPPKKGS